MTPAFNRKTLLSQIGLSRLRVGPKFLAALCLGSIGWVGAGHPVQAQEGWLLFENSPAKEMANALEGWSLPTKPAVTRNAAGREVVGKSDRPKVPLFAYGTVVTTGFTGVRAKVPYVYADGRTVPAPLVAMDFIDPNGAAANLLGVDGIGYDFNGSEFTRAANFAPWYREEKLDVLPIRQTRLGNERPFFRVKVLL